MQNPSIDFHAAYTYGDAISRAAAESRIDREYWDIFGKRHEISPEAQKSILADLGWDLSSTEVIERQRVEHFRREWTAVLPPTAVIGETDKSIYISFPAGIGGRVAYTIELENGGQLTGSLDAAELQWVGDVHLGSDRWARFRWILPEELPLGYHKLSLSIESWPEKSECHLIVCPERAYLPEHLNNGGRAAGFNITLYGLRSDRNWGVGDFTDLGALIDWAHDEVGFSFVGLNPLHALHNRVPYNTSPYLPLSLYYKNLIYIDIEAVSEFKDCRCAQQLLSSESVQNELSSYRQSEFVAYHEVTRLKRKFLKLLFREFRRARKSNPDRERAFARFCEQEGDRLYRFSLYSALDEVLHKQDRSRWTWRQWPEEYRTPDSDSCLQFARDHSRTIEFYSYIQFVLDEQLAAAHLRAKERGLTIGLYHDLALATDSCGADLWAYRDFYVSGCRVGAPPDDFSPNGQDWAFPPPNSERHRNSGYLLYRESIRNIVNRGGALRIDHVMRLIRLFWIPSDATAAQGTYVLDYATDLMRILALESQRSKNIVIGEDLGTVTDEMRDMLARFGILSYRLFPFEKNRDGSFKHSWEYPTQALVASSTHDLPTMAGFWTMRDIEARRKAGLAGEQTCSAQARDRRKEKQQMLNTLHAENLLPASYSRDADAIPEVDGDLHNAIVGFLARVPSMLLLLNQEDLTKETEQQNLPGSTAEYPNWQRKMRARLEDLRTAQEWTGSAAMFRNQLRRNGR